MAQCCHTQGRGRPKWRPGMSVNVACKTISPLSNHALPNGACRSLKHFPLRDQHQCWLRPKTRAARNGFCRVAHDGGIPARHRSADRHEHGCHGLPHRRRACGSGPLTFRWPSRISARQGSVSGIAQLLPRLGRPDDGSHSTSLHISLAMAHPNVAAAAPEKITRHDTH